MGLILLIVVLVVLFGGGGGYYAHSYYGGAGLGGVLGVVVRRARRAVAVWRHRHAQALAVRRRAQPPARGASYAFSVDLSDQM